MKILVRNLSREITENDIKPLFEKFGTVESCVLVIDERTARSKGFGFVEMPNEEEAKAALKALDLTKVGQNKMKVRESTPKTDEEEEKDPVESKSKTTVNRDLLYGVSLDEMVTCLVAKYGWKGLNFRIELNCFRNDPSVSSSIKFLRTEYWAQKKVETLYLSMDKADRVDKEPYKAPEKPEPEPKAKPSVWDKGMKKHKDS